MMGEAAAETGYSPIYGNTAQEMLDEAYAAYKAGTITGDQLVQVIGGISEHFQDLRASVIKARTAVETGGAIERDPRLHAGMRSKWKGSKGIPQ